MVWYLVYLILVFTVGMSCWAFYNRNVPWGGMFLILASMTIFVLAIYSKIPEGI